MNLTAEFGNLTGDKLGRAMLLEAKLGVSVQVLPPGGHFAVKQIDEMWNLHDEHLQHGMLRTGTPMFVSKANAACVA
jgi:hypothetical protein